MFCRELNESGFPLAADELLNTAVSFVIGHLDRGMLGKISGRRTQNTANAAIQPELTTADGIDRNSGGVGRVLNRKLEVQLHRHVAKKATLDPNKGDLVITLPGHVVARADMDILIREPFPYNGLDGFGF